MLAPVKTEEKVTKWGKQYPVGVRKKVGSAPTNIERAATPLCKQKGFAEKRKTRPHLSESKLSINKPAQSER